MAIAGAQRSAVKHGHPLRRRNRSRTRAAIVFVASIGAWGAFFLALGWLVAAGFYGLLTDP